MPTPEKEWIVPGQDAARLDRHLAEKFPTISRAYLQELIATGKVLVNGKKGKKGQVLARGDQVKMEPFELPEERRITPNPEIPLKLVFESENFLVIDKPAHLPTHPNSYSDANTLANALIGKFPELIGVGDDHLRPGIVHRLDTDTSGLLLVARTQEIFRQLRTLFDERKIKKTYLALVIGDVQKDGEISFAIAHHATNPRRMVAVRDDEKVRSRVREAKTKYVVKERFGDFTLLEVKTLTGRMHQVRVHLGAIGHPLAGDKIYQSPKERALDKSTLGRHFLHACELVVPFSGKDLPFTSELPSELKEMLSELRKKSQPG